MKSVKIPKKSNEFIDSVIVYGSRSREVSFPVVDSIFVYYTSKHKKPIYIRDKDVSENYEPNMVYNGKQNCFAHFSQDNNLDLFFANDTGGSGGICYNVFIYHKKSNIHKIVNQLTFKPKVCFIKKSNHYLSIWKSGIFIGAERFVLSGDTTRQLSSFSTEYFAGGTSRYDSTKIVYNYAALDSSEKVEKCYRWVEFKSDKEKTTCSKFMKKLEKQLWSDWEVYGMPANN